MNKRLRGKITGIQHIGIPTRDMKKTEEFYGKLGFETAFETVNEGAAVKFLKLGNLVIEAYESEEAKGFYGAIDHIAVDVENVEEIFQEICEMGLNTLNDTVHFLPFWENGARFFTIEGPNKERVEFSQML